MTEQMKGRNFVSSNDSLEQQFTAAQRTLDQLDAAFDSEEWEKVEALIQERDNVLHQALTSSLPVTFHQRANALLRAAQTQNQLLLNKAEAQQKNASRELQRINSSRKKINAYNIEASKD